MNEEKETTEKSGCGCTPGKCRCGRCGGGKRWFIIPLFVIAAVLIVGAVVMYLWNAVIPHVFTSVGVITYCQAIGILILSKILFGGFRKGGFRGRGRFRDRQCKEKWMSMSEEERAKFKEEWKNRSGSCGC